MPLRVAIVGGGPAALYAAAELARTNRPEVSVNLFDRLSTLGGLARAGVAPDHAERRGMIEVYARQARRNGRFRFFGNVEIGTHLTHTDLCRHHHAVIYATGAADSRPLAIPGADLPGCHAASAFVGWYNGHPDHADLDPDLDCERAVVIGNGNVALDVARLLLADRDTLAASDMADHARAALAAGAGHHSAVGQTTAYLFDARRLVEHAARWIEKNFPAQNPSGNCLIVYRPSPMDASNARSCSILYKIWDNTSRKTGR